VLVLASYTNEPDAVPPPAKVTPVKVQSKGTADAETDTTLNAMTTNRVLSRFDRIFTFLDVDERSATADNGNAVWKNSFCAEQIAYEAMSWWA
jgi:hypothetical protein